MDGTYNDAQKWVVQILLDFRHYGDRIAHHWLDLARFTDANGYSIDCGRQMWLWTIPVSSSILENEPFDTFKVEQLPRCRVSC